MGNFGSIIGNDFHKFLKLFVLVFFCNFFYNPMVASADSISKASTAQINNIKVLLNRDVTVLDSGELKSSSHQNAHYVGLLLNISGIERHYGGVWLVSGDKNKPGMVLAVDGVAQQFSRATPADKTNPPTAYMSDVECKRLMRYFDKN